MTNLNNRRKDSGSSAGALHYTLGSNLSLAHTQSFSLSRHPRDDDRTGGKRKDSGSSAGVLHYTLGSDLTLAHTQSLSLQCPLVSRWTAGDQAHDHFSEGLKEYETPCPIRFYAVVSSIYLLI